MSIVIVKVVGNVQQEQKEQLMDRFSTTMQEVLGKNPETVHIVIEEVAEENWGLRGKSIAALNAGK